MFIVGENYYKILLLSHFFNQQVYDFTNWIAQHPGGDAMLRQAGRDATVPFKTTPGHRFIGKLATEIMRKHYIGQLEQ